jgi:sulfur carrier protein
MKISLNGVMVAIDADANVTDAVAATGHSVTRPFGLAVALNGEVVPRSAWQTTPLEEADKVEVLVASQGG